MRWRKLSGEFSQRYALRNRLTWWWIAAALLVCVAGLWARAAQAQDAECAEVKIVIEQKLSLERQAFDAHMVIRNGLDSSALSNVKIDLLFKDQDQNDVVATSDANAAGATFFVRADTLTGLSATDGSASLPAKTTADIRWLIIPSQGAGGTTPEGRLYYIGARVTYTLDGQTSTVNVTPDYVVVRPQPLLRLDYFLPTDVFADDPFTPEVEPPETFTLGVRIANVGAGPANKTRIESAQPKIVENRQGLLIDFLILGGYVGNELAGKSLLLDFGDIAPLTSKMGRWLMQTTLAGRFTEFNASFVHADSLGGAVTSLIKEVVTHKLVHDVRVDLPGHDDIDDFLAEQGDGYRVYDSEGGDNPVFNVSPTASLTSTAGGNLSLQFAATQGFVHVKLADPGRGSKKPVQVLRSDGKALLAQNFWLSRSRNQDLSWNYFVHIFDANSTGQYTLVMSESATARLAGQVYRDSNGNGIREPGELAEGNLGVTLKGVDAEGRNVLLQGYTDPQGDFSYGSVPPGKYQLEAASRDGVVNGTWVAGSVGGKASPGLISDIVLLAGSNGTGYLLSKRAPSPGTGETTSADASVSIQSSLYQLKPGQSASVTVQVQNIGPSAAQSVSVQVAVPEGLTLQTSSASLGSYVNGVWAVGSVNKDQSATLTLTVVAATLSDGSSRSIAWPASIGAQTTDPVAGNNRAQINLLVQSDQEQVTLAQALVPQARILAWTSCPQVEPVDQEMCAQEKAQTAQAWLTGKTQHVFATGRLGEWQVALRSGKYNMLWLSGGTSGLDATSLAEIRAAVRRGDTLIVEGAAAPGVVALADVLGAVPADATLGNGLDVRLLGAASAQTTAGKAYALELQSASKLASYEVSSLPAIAGQTFGNGQTLLAGFDLLGTISNPAHAAWSEYQALQIKALTPVVRTSPALGGSIVPVRLTVRNPASSGTPDKAVTLQTTVPAGIQYENVTPQPQVGASPEVLNWTWTLTAAQERSALLELRMPEVSGQSQVVSRALRTLDQKSVAEQILPLSVLGLDVVAPRVGETLAALSIGTTSGRALLEEARQANTSAKDAQAQSQWGSTIVALASLQTHIDALAASPNSLPLQELQLDIARWMALVQTRWMPDAVEPPAQVISVRSEVLTAIVGQPFGSPLQAKVLDRLGRPIGGVTVRFEFPLSSSSALFVSGASASAVTNEQGVATSPVFTANSVVGKYTASASVTGVTTAANFALENLPAAVGQLLLQGVEGANQTARVSTLYGKPLSVRVVNAQSQPQAGISVRFELPQTGASAQFEAGAAASNTVVQAITGPDGVATSPVLRANAQVGAFKAIAGLVGQGGSSTVDFQLSNLATSTPTPTPRFEGTTPTGTGRFTATVSGGGASCAFNPDATRLLPAQGMGAVLGKLLLPHGVFDFELVGCTLGGEVTITTTWPDLRGITGYLKYGVTPISGGRKIWYPPRGLHISGHTVTYTIRDGGWGDDDLTVNGVIRDPGGPVIAAVAPAVNPAPIPAMDARALALLSLMLVAVAGMVLRYRARNK